MFGIGETELVIIVVFAFLLFGPDKLPGMGRTLGRVLRQFREASDGFTEVVQTNIMDPASEELEKSPKQRRREAAEAFEEDADREDAATPSEEPAPKRESFAERRARLKAEHEAAEASREEAAEAGKDESVDKAEAAGNAQDAVANAEDEARTSAASLYAMTSRKSSRKLAEEAQAAEAQATSEPEPPVCGEEDGSDEA